MKKIFILLFAAVSFYLSDSAFADDPNHKGIDMKQEKKCETACHTPENVKKAQEDKVQVEECKDCHVGPDGNLDKKIVPFVQAANQNSGKADNTPSKNLKSYEDMALIPAGETLIGTNERWDDEGPQYKFFIDAFYMDIYEVSNEKYKEFVDATNHKKPNHWQDEVYFKEKKDHPVVYVNWHDAADYCSWRGKRLPKQEEWEKAARGTDGRAYPWGNDFDPNKSNNPFKESKGTEPVNSYPNGKSPYGVYNMSGNVWEWTDGWYKPYPGNTKERKNYGETHRVLKGGSWYNCHSYDCGLSAPVYNRAPFEPDVKGNSFGFRCAKNAK